MKTTFLKSILTPVIFIIICFVLYFLGYYQMIFAAILAILASAIEYKKGLFKSLGFKKINIKRHFILAPILGIFLFYFSGLILLPSITYVTGKPIDYSVFEVYKGNLLGILQIFVYMIFSAAFGEEIVFRGYLMQQITKFFGSSKLSLFINIALLGILFGLSHLYQGITGIILTGIMGIIFGVIFHLRKNDLWFTIIVHAFVDIVGLVYIYYGWL